MAPRQGQSSCRLCKEENHIPLRCEEVEKASDTKKRLSMCVLHGRRTRSLLFSAHAAFSV